ncbi:MAG: GAF domain-containing protein [Dechloromonas sp.]|nr:MAG: GAF domain-containing protein [Dechloromonas sp.]
MLKNVTVRFQHWVLGLLMLLVVALSALFLATVFKTFTHVAEDRALGNFSLIAEQTWLRLDGLLQGSARFVTAQAHGEVGQFADEGGRLNRRDMVAGFIAAIEADAGTYSHFFGLGNEEFLQVIGIRGDERLIAALQAPPSSHFAVRRIIREPGQTAREEWSFLDRQRLALASRPGDGRFLPSQRPWFTAALQRDGLIVTDPYLFASTGQLGITVATPLPGRIGVLASDISLASLQDFLGSLALPENGLVAIQDGQGRILALHARGARYAGLRVEPLSMPAALANPYLAVLAPAAAGRAAEVTTLGPGAGERFVVARRQSQPVGGSVFTVVVSAPLSDFLGPFRQAERDVIWMSVLILLILLPLAYLGSRQVVRALQAMAEDSERLKHLDFSQVPHAPDSFLYEIKVLGEAQCVMQGAIHRRTEDLDKAQKKLASLVDNGIRLTREQDRSVLFQHILAGAREISHCAAATLFLKSERNTLVFAERTFDDVLPHLEIPLYGPDGAPNDRFVVVHAAIHNETVLIDDVYAETRFDLSGTKRFSEESGLRAVSMLTVPLSPREGEVIGLIQLINAIDPQSGEIIPFPPDILGFVEALAAQSAVALENHNLLEAQRELMEALIRLLAGAIDAKSAYTGGHCERVPELAFMLAQAACDADSGPLADFRFADDEAWREFRIGAWLHDCGKVTTPEYVVDKATKLETIYNRIHEVRTRFEVLLRDAEIERLLAIHQHGLAPAEAEARYAARRQQLLDDFAFVAECNLGGEFMAAERVERLKRIAEETWLRHFDDRLGLSHEEHERYAATPAGALPVRERLLADQPWHIVPRRRDNPAYDARHGWQVTVPEHLYNFGELYNLSVGRGTLTEEERFKINEHIIQTIVMLEQLPLPKQFRRVPEYAGTHHETMIGTGYPRRLAAEQLSIPSRIMAIADIFEALTASDRPYKPMKKLSECIRILSFFKKDRHIDPDLFDLFLTSGVYRQYAERYLKPEQIDDVDIGQYVDAPAA